MLQFGDDFKKLTKETDIRKYKIDLLKSNGINPYAPKFDQEQDITTCRSLPDGAKVKVAGRMVFRRIFGKLSFCQISDIYNKIQVSVSVNELPVEDYDFFKNFIDIGDFIGVCGELYHTHTGELTIRANSVQLLSKALRGLPEKFHGLSDMETRYRQRYLDMISNEDAKDIFVTRSKVISFIRNFLVDHGFLEVETPILQNIASGAAAKPFITKHNALDKTYYLRIAPELFLKQVVCGGIPRVFEIGKNFRNEGMDASHLQEFTMLEWYASYWDYNKNIDFVTELIQSILDKFKGTQKITYQGVELDFSGTWDKVDYIKALNDVLGLDILSYTDGDKFREDVRKLGIIEDSELDATVGLDKLFDLVYKRKVRPNIVRPTVLYHYPNLVPLVRPNDEDPRTTEMFQVLVAGTELVKAYSELVDPALQRAGFEEQMRNKAKGDEEAFNLDEDFLLAMEHGMPPMSGLGLGIDRLIAILLDQPTLRDVILFPNMK